MPTATVNPHTPDKHARAAASKLRGKLHRATVNSVTRSGWFVCIFGLVFSLATLLIAGHEMGRADGLPNPYANGGPGTASELGSIPFHDDPCAGNPSCPELDHR